MTLETKRREYHANGTYWSGVPTVNLPCDFCGLTIVKHDPRTHACPVVVTSGNLPSCVNPPCPWPSACSLLKKCQNRGEQTEWK